MIAFTFFSDKGKINRSSPFLSRWLEACLDSILPCCLWQLTQLSYFFGRNLFESIAFMWMCESLSVAVIEITTAFKSSWLPFLL
jgi:hypothetical protein